VRRLLFASQGLVGLLILTGLLYNNFWRVALLYMLRLVLVFVLAAKNDVEATRSTDGKATSLVGGQAILAVSLFSDAVLIAYDVQLGHMH